MNAKWKKVLALMLALAMTVAAFCIPTALAKEQKNEYDINQMVVLGDSFAQGMDEYVGGSGGWFGSYDVGYGARVADALNLLQADRYRYIWEKDGNTGKFYSIDNQSNKEKSGSGLEEQEYFHAWGAAAFRTDEILNMIDETYVVNGGADEDDWKTVYYDHWLEYQLSRMDKYGYRETLLTQLKSADLITLQVGSNDFFIGPVQTTIWELEDEFGLKDAKADLLSIVGMGTANANDTFDSTELATAFFKKFIPRVLEGYTRFTQNFPKIMQKLRELNPNAQIVVIGETNPLYYIKKIEIGNTSFELGSLLNSVLLPANSVLAGVGALYGAKYVDAKDIALDGDFHPAPDGYQTIADRIVDKLTVNTNFKDMKLLTAENKKAVLWGASTGYFPGYSDTVFAPAGFAKVSDIAKALNEIGGNQNETYAALAKDSRVLPRKQLVTMLFQFAQNMGDATALQYTDALTWASATGITKGVSNIQMKAITPCTRAQAVLFLYRFVTNAYSPAAASVEGVADDLADAAAALG